MDFMNMNQELMFDGNNSNWSMSSAGGLEPPKKKRTRARLDHMTQEEKQERRKEKNRQAAQTARDRKRERLDRLEAENQRLREENMRLRSAILGNSREQSIVDRSSSHQQARSNNNNPLPPVIQITDSGVSDVDTKSATTTSLTTSTSSADESKTKLDRHEGSDGRTMTPDSSSNYGTATTLSPAPSDDQLINSIIERDNDIALVNEVQKLVSYVNGDLGDDVSLESAALINEPQQQVQDISTGSRLAENSLGWTSVQLMLILLISRIHHRLSVKINCCQRAPTKSIERQQQDEVDPINSNLLDYILHTKCVNFRRAAETIISNKNNVRHQRIVALEFVQKYLYHTNLARQNQNQNDHNTSPARGTSSCLVRARQ